MVSASPGKDEPLRLARVSSEDAGSARVRQYRDPASARHGLVRQQCRPSNSSSSRSVRMVAPAWSNRASTTVSLEASAPVWELAARDPADDRPAFKATMGSVSGPRVWRSR